MSHKTFALVTGASAGIGKAVAEELASRKINVLLIALPGTGLMDVVENIAKSFSVQTDGFEMDLTIPGSANIVFEWCKTNGYGVNILVNNAGFGNLGSFESTDPLVLANMMLLNNQALVLLTHAFLPELKKSTPGYILNLGSLASFMPIPNKSVYAATKSFVYAFSSSLRMELMPHRIRVSCLCPGGTLTNKDVTNRIQTLGAAGKVFTQMPDEVAREAVTGMFRGKHRIIPGWHNRLLYTINQLFPEFLVCAIIQQLFNRKNQPKKVRITPAFPKTYSLSLIYRL